MNERTIKYYVGRINTENGEEQIIRMDRFSGLPRTVNEMNPGDAFDDAVVGNQLSARLNGIAELLEYPHYYYRVDSDQQTRKIIRDDAPEEVLKWFQDEPEEEPEEEQTEGE